MYNAKDLAMYIIQLDKNNEVFNLELATYNDRTFYEGNCRLNKMLQLTQNIYYVGTGKRLIKEDMYAYDNGGVIPEIQENYKSLLKEKNDYKVEIIDEHLIKIINNVYEGFGKDTHIADVIRISHQDPEWQNKNKYYEKEFQKMELSNINNSIIYKSKMESLAKYIGDYKNAKDRDYFLVSKEDYDDWD